MLLVDAHCHLGDAAFDRDREGVLVRARAGGVGPVVVIGGTVAESERAAALARGGPGLSATAGLPPPEARAWSPEAAARLKALLALPEVVAVGETGLDYHYDHSPRDVQRRAFAAQLALAAELDKPVVVHAREADDDIAAMLAGAGATVVLHSFSSGVKLFEAGMQIGAYLSFSGMITFKSWRFTAALTDYPPDRPFVHTDAPSPAPPPHRGKPNEPGFGGEGAEAPPRAPGGGAGAGGETTRESARGVLR